jgi:hypothetical protein
MAFSADVGTPAPQAPPEVADHELAADQFPDCAFWSMVRVITPVPVMFIVLAPADKTLGLPSAIVQPAPSSSLPYVPDALEKVNEP